MKHKHNRESHHLPHFLVLQMNCPDSSPRNKAKNALSLAVPISPGMAGAKIGKISFGWREKKEIFHKSAENTVSFWRILVFLQHKTI
jgi:hypothetical protein